MDVSVKFVAHIDQRKRPEGFPSKVTNVGTYAVSNTQELADRLQQEFATILGMQGMIVSLGNPTIEIEKLNVKGRVFVPMHMITHITTDVEVMATPMPRMASLIEDKDGKQVAEYETPEGKKVLPS